MMGVLTRESEGFQGHCPGGHTNDFTEINIKLGVWPITKMNTTPPSTATSIPSAV